MPPHLAGERRRTGTELEQGIPALDGADGCHERHGLGLEEPSLAVVPLRDAERPARLLIEADHRQALADAIEHRLRCWCSNVAIDDFAQRGRLQHQPGRVARAQPSWR